MAVAHCILLTRRKALSAGLLRSELAFAAAELENSRRRCNVQQQFLSPVRRHARLGGSCAVPPSLLLPALGWSGCGHREESAEVWCELGVS